jgi:hypothetical protein
VGGGGFDRAVFESAREVEGQFEDVSLDPRQRPEFWMNLQSHYDLKTARRKLKPEEEARIKAQRAA